MDLWKVVAEPRRREILRHIWADELAAGELAARCGGSFPAVSQHLAVLRESGLVTVRRAGKHRYYRAEQEALGGLAPLLEAMWRQDLDRLAAAAEAEEAGRKEGRRTRRS